MDCVFCKIIAWDIPSVKIWENDDFLAILDAFPACVWQTLVIPKHHYDSDIFVMDTAVYSSLLLATKEVVALMKKWLQVERIGMVVEGLQVPHAHIKLYPFWWWKSFEGWLTWHTMASLEDLRQVADKMKIFS